MYLHLTGGTGAEPDLSDRGAGGGSDPAAGAQLFVRPADWWKDYLPTPKIQLGLDLQGGTHLLLDVKLDDAVKNALSRRADDLKRELKDSKIAFSDISVSGDSVQVKLSDPP